MNLIECKFLKLKTRAHALSLINKPDATPPRCQFELKPPMIFSRIGYHVGPILLFFMQESDLFSTGRLLQNSV